MGMAGFWRTARARRAAVGTIGPMVERTRARVGPLPESGWRQPYMIGFMTMLISLAARHGGRQLASDDLGIVQAESWHALTGLADDRIGEDICLLSACGDAAFMEGCANAARLLEARRGRFDSDDPEIRALHEEAEGAFERLSHDDVSAFGDVLVAAMWCRYFEDRIG